MSGAAADGTLAVTFFRDEFATEKDEQHLSLSELARRIEQKSAPAKGRLPWVKLALFGTLPTAKNSLRWDGNVITIAGAEADYDGEIVSFDKAVEIAEKAGLLAIIYTSPSHTASKPRWRILCPTSTALAPDRRTHLIDRLNGLYGGVFAAESWTLSQSYYFGSVNNNPDHRVAIVDGQPIDRLEELDFVAIGKPATKAASGNGAYPSPGGYADEAALLQQIITGESYHNAAIRLLGLWAHQGIAMIEAERRVRDAFDGVFPPDRDHRWHDRVNEIPKLLDHVWGKEAAKPKAASQPSEGEAPRSPIPVFDAGDIDITSIPPRKWLLGTTFCRKFLSGLISEGGVGKTAIRYAEYLASASGRNLTNEYVHIRCRVLIVCLEDDLNEVRRRIGAGMAHHRIAPADIKGWLFYCTPRGLKLLQTDPRGGRTIGELDAELRATIKERQIDLVGIDPFIKAHGVEENDNNAIDQVCIMLADIADEYDVAIDLISHARKGAATPGDADRDRGASSKRDAGRLMRTATGMTEEEAKLFGLDAADRVALIRVDDAKVNLAPRSGKAMWFKLVGVALGNGAEPYPNGDNVQAVERWYPPDHFKGVPDDIWNKILDDIEAGTEDGGKYTDANRAAPKRQAWRIVAKHTGKPDADSKTVIRTWKKNGVITLEKYYDEDQRKNVLGFVVDASKRPGPRL